MLTFDINKTKVSFTFGFFFLIAINATSDDTLTLFCLLFSIIHELSHLLVMRIYGIGICGMRFYGGGIKISTHGMELIPKFDQAVIYSAGCLMNLLLGTVFCFSGGIRMCIINLSLAAFNLLPVEYFDGGKLLKLLMPNNDRFCRTVSKLTFAVIIAMAVMFALAVPVEISPSAVITAAFIALSELLD